MTGTIADSIGVTHAIDAFGRLDSSDPVDDIDVVKARLAARGLLRTESTVVVRRPAARQPGERRPVFTAPPPDAVEASPTEEAETWDVRPESIAMTTVGCPRCRQQHPWPADVTRFVCTSCDRGWRWAPCAGCRHLALVVENVESWRCSECNHYSRSWWRTPEMRKEAALVVARRREVAADAERARLRAGARRRRRGIAAGAVAAALMVGGFVVAVRTSEPTAAEATATTCARFERLRSNLANGTITRDGVTRELRRLRADSTTATPAVQATVVELAGAGRPGQATFLVASTNLADACT